MSASSGPKVLFIIGKGRSGSTLLDTILGELSGFFSAGELWRRWGGSRLSRYPCGCGQELEGCPVWSPALAGALEVTSTELGRPVTDEDVLEWERSVARWHWIPRLLLQGRSAAGAWPRLDRLVRFAGALYRELAEREGARVIIDSSKWPANPGALGLVPGVRSYRVHLVRDPRAVAHSWQRSRRFREGGRPMPRFGPVHSALSWNARNLVADVTRSREPKASLLLRYEDFAADPPGSVERILDMLDETAEELPFTAPRTVRLGSNHTVWGNPSRFERGEVRIREDREWMDALGPVARAATTALTAPLLARYGYSLRGGS